MPDHEHHRELAPSRTGSRGQSLAALLALLLSLSASGSVVAKPPEFRREWLEPYLRAGIGAQARLHLQAGAPLKAIPLLRKLRGSADEALQARYLLAHALLETRQHAAAAALFEELSADYPLLADYCRFHGAQALFRQGELGRAEATAGRVTAGSALKLEAELLRADALRTLGRLGELVPIWEAYLAKHPKGGRAGHAHLHLGEALEQQATSLAGPAAAELLGKALEHYRQAVIRSPLSSAFVEATRRLNALAAALPDGAKRAALGGWDSFEQALAYFRTQRNAESEAAFAAILRGKEVSPLLRCKAAFYQAKSIFKQRQRARSAPIYEQAVAACRKASEDELTVKGLFDLAKALMHAKRHKDAIARLGELEKGFPTHSYADDARLWAAEAYDTLKQPAEVTRLLSSLPKLYPKGDMAHEALWRLARAAYLDRKPELALQYLDEAIALGRPRYYYSAGQALYWKARVLEGQGKPKEARAAYEACIRDFPMSYYALLGFNRLRERHPALYGRLRDELLAPVGSRPGRWGFAANPLYAKPGFLRGVELARLGFAEAAAQELTRAGLNPKEGNATEEELWLAAVLFDRAGLWQLSHAVPRDADPQLRRSYPLADAWRRWSLAYPPAYQVAVKASARRARIPEELVWSIMREESGFAPATESYANALGLMQLILPTARAAGHQSKLAVTRDLLRDPAINIRLGATYLGFLYGTFQRMLPLAIAGYNAGEGGVYRWLSQLGAVPLDEFIERIPYDQTRRYTKRVLSTLFTYSTLYKRGEAKLPRIPQKLPRVTAKAFGS